MSNNDDDEEDDDDNPVDGNVELDEPAILQRNDENIFSKNDQTISVSCMQKQISS